MGSEMCIRDSYDQDVVLQIEVDEISEAWSDANARYWPMSFFAKRRVRKQLHSYSPDRKPDPGRDLPQLKTMREQLQRLDENPLAEQEHLWNGFETNGDDLRSHLKQATEVRKAIVSLGKGTGTLSTLSSKVAPVLSADSSEHKTCLLYTSPSPRDS